MTGDQHVPTNIDATHLTLPDWLRAQLDHDEQVALGVSLGPHKPERWSATQYKGDSRGWRVDGQHSCVVDGAFGPDAEHIARHDPARVLREVDAKRRILDDIGQYVEDEEEHGFPSTDGFAGRVLTYLALPYADRAGYRDEWRLDA